jgi:ubiquinone biosynthesis protein COQ4
MKHNSGVSVSGGPVAAGSNPSARLARRSENSLGRIRTALVRWFGTVKSFTLMMARKDQRVFHATHFLIATEGNAFEFSLLAFRATPGGRELLHRRPSLWENLSDRSTLQACAADSLGRWYIEHMSSFALDEGYYLSVVRALNEQFEKDPERAWLRTRIDSAHDLRHVLTGYRTNDWGEVCLQCFRFGQTGHVGSLILSLFGLLAVRLRCRGPVLRSWQEAYRRGRDAKLLDLLHWENALDQPLSIIRAAMGLHPAKYYPLSIAPEAYVDFGGETRRAAPAKTITLDAA